MPITPTVPVVPAAIANYGMTAVVTLEPTATVVMSYWPADAQGNAIGAPSIIQMNGAGLTAFNAASGGLKAKFYAALAAQVPALAGVVT